MYVYTYQLERIPPLLNNDPIKLNYHQLLSEAGLGVPPAFSSTMLRKHPGRINGVIDVLLQGVL